MLECELMFDCELMLELNLILEWELIDFQSLEDDHLKQYTGEIQISLSLCLNFISGFLCKSDDSGEWGLVGQQIISTISI